MRQSSLAIHMRVIVYSCGQLPAVITSLEEIATTASQLSVAVAIPSNAGDVPLVQSMTKSGGHAITGGVTSSTVII